MSWRNPKDRNVVETEKFSNPDTDAVYRQGNPRMRDRMWDCLCCSFYAALNEDFGVCCFPKSQYHLETVFEHFVCDDIVYESSSEHSFTEDRARHFSHEGLMARLIGLYQILARSRASLRREDLQAFLAAEACLLGRKRAWEEDNPTYGGRHPMFGRLR